MPTFLLEIGVEELPAFAIAPAIEQLKTGLLARLQSERLGVPPSSVETFATPRRLTLRINDALPARQPDADVEAKGPSAKAAFDASGAPTKALIGFAAKQGVPVEKIVVENDYVIARKVEPGRAAGDILQAIVPEIVRGLTFPKFLRWGAGNFRFGRPLRRIVALLDEAVVPIELEGIAAGRETPGHRYTTNPVVFQHASEYETNLRRAFVEPDADVRRKNIVSDAERLAASVGGVAILPDALVTENVFLTEWTTGVLGNFDAAYLALPRAVLTTSMAKNQRFFPIEGADGNLLPHFIAIRNGDAEHLEIVRVGYEKVLASRFNDARFFFENDRKTTLAHKLAKTGRIVFQEKLGTLADKTRRLLSLMETTGLLAWTRDQKSARRAVELSKADLASEIVAELTSLQGVMGRQFAKLEGEGDVVADALFEQYLPKAAGDSLPTGRVGTALSLADRVDTLVGYMRFVGAEPRGSSDPFGLKRAATAIVDLLACDETLPTLSALLVAAENGYVAQGVPRAEKSGDLHVLMETRLRSLLEERGVRLDIVDATLGAHANDGEASDILHNVAPTIARADLLQRRLIVNRETGVLQPGTRIRNILRNIKTLGEIGKPDTTAISETTERDLYNALRSVASAVRRDLDARAYEAAFDTLAALETPVVAFFDNVMVMADDANARNLRLALLKEADALYLGLADFTKVTAE